MRLADLHSQPSKTTATPSDNNATLTATKTVTPTGTTAIKPTVTTAVTPGEHENEEAYMEMARCKADHLLKVSLV